MTISEKDIKLLWGRSASLCALDRCKLTQDKDSVMESMVLGEQAHIVGEKEGAARGISLLTLDERNTYSNLILLCPNHHTLIDKNYEDYPVERLHLIKRQHEEWVQTTLGHNDDPRVLANQLIYAHVIDLTVEKARLHSWRDWSFYALSPDPRWYKEMDQELSDYRVQVENSVWPRTLPELEATIRRLARVLTDAAYTFFNNSAKWAPDDRLVGPDKSYKNHSYPDDATYEYAESKHFAWLDSCQLTMWEATRAANWFADVVRRDVNPLFFAFNGRFSVRNSPVVDENDLYREHILEYSVEEKKRFISEFSETL